MTPYALPVRHDGSPRLISTTFVARLSRGGPLQEYYAARSTEPLVEEALALVMERDRETLRRLCAALEQKFVRTFYGRGLREVRSSRLDRAVRFERDEHGQLTKLAIIQMSNEKVVLSLVTPPGYLESREVRQVELPQEPFRYRSRSSRPS